MMHDINIKEEIKCKISILALLLFSNLSMDTRRLRQLRIEENVGFHKSLITNHAEGNSMASPTQMVVGKGIPKPLIAKDLLKSYGTWSRPLL